MELKQVRLFSWLIFTSVNFLFYKELEKVLLSVDVCFFDLLFTGAEEIQQAGGEHEDVGLWDEEDRWSAVQNDS